MNDHWEKDTNPEKTPLIALKPHSARPGAATKANSHKGMNTQDIIPRGGWDLDGMQNIFNYVHGTFKQDIRNPYTL